MNTFMTERIKQYWFQWARRRNAPGEPQRLENANLYILPSGFGWAYGAVLLTLFLCAINYQISAIFLFTFFLAIIGMISAWATHANLKGLTITSSEIVDVPRGSPVAVRLLVKSAHGQRFSLHCAIPPQTHQTIDCLPEEGKELTLYLPGERRGCFTLPPIQFHSVFPFGLFRTWGYVFFDKTYSVYPEPVSPGFWPKAASSEEGSHKISQTGIEDLENLRPVGNPWVQVNRIAWKIAARGQGWYLKTMSNPEGRLWLFKLDDMPAMDIEQKLQHLSYWLIEAEQQGLVYGLELRGIRTAFSQGANHLKQCLRQLAAY